MRQKRKRLLEGACRGLILHAEEDRAKLFDLWLAYRNASPEAALLGKAKAGQVIPFRQPQIGRPRKNP
jgi:hypothetical protein